MRLVGLDLETTGLDPNADRITEVGVVLWDTDTHSPLTFDSHFLWDEGIEARCTEETRAMMQRVSGIKVETLKEFGLLPGSVLSALSAVFLRWKPEYIVAHNGENFDRLFIQAECKRHGVLGPLTSLPWIDTRADIPHDTPPDSMKLKHLALDAGFINPFPHRALTDVLTMLKVLSQYDIDKVVAYSKIPWIVVRAMVSFEERQLAKDQRFSWEVIEDKKWEKSWVKKVKADQLAAVQAACKFKVVQVA